MVTGLIYGGPTVVKRINKGLVKLLARDGYAHIAEAIGAEGKKK
jgi:dihydroorotate dehydrogenase